MKGKRALLLFVFILFFVLPAANTAWIKYAGSSDPAAGDLPDELTEREINLNNGGKYRDGLVDTFDYFRNPGYPIGSTHDAENNGST
ncbi:hypothetical protein MSSIT_0684 [Methanosarcina siciliae T4/M]|uniref:Uncharacterized protein n=2 Tax=Methanosarcina siciliae TaxID=38027 RepID=A0A0E3LA38_9EURY|nr:hypothetical protein [Methanosarcina siciliae]AKB27403.1 hypothetical protein MSSIT_0684 [Methanosarcina siciliae T4/M]AKB31346.1 hypothetical protein MSSIH_0656 [Methanosarcina siciliae HI350]